MRYVVHGATTEYANSSSQETEVKQSKTQKIGGWGSGDQSEQEMKQQSTAPLSPQALVLNSDSSAVESLVPSAIR